MGFSLDFMPPHPPDCVQASTSVYMVISLLCDRELRYDAIVSLFLQKLLLRGVRYGVMEPFILCRVSLEINNGQMGIMSL